MKTLYVAWKKKDPGGWWPVGRLDADVRKGVYSFRYLHGAYQAAEAAGFTPFDSFPEFQKEYVSDTLFPFFLNRVTNSSRPSFPDYLKRLDLASSPDHVADPIDMLAVSQGKRTTDNLEVFPKIERVPGSPLALKFFLHGLRFLSPQGFEESLKLQPGAELIVALEVTNPATRFAIQFQTGSKVMIGYAPHYLVRELAPVLLECNILATVVRVNLPPTPPGQRVLVLLQGCWPENFEPMTKGEYEPVLPSEAFESSLIGV